MDAQNTNTPGVNDFSRLLAFRYKLANALKSKSIDSFDAFEKKICRLTVNLTMLEYMHESVSFLLCAFFAENKEEYLKHIEAISYEDFDENFERIDGLVYASWQQVISNHEDEILKIKLEVTKHEFQFDPSERPCDYPGGSSPGMCDLLTKEP